MPAVRDFVDAVAAVADFLAAAVVAAGVRFTIVVPLLASLPVLGREAAGLAWREAGRVVFEAVTSLAVGFGRAESLNGEAGLTGEAALKGELGLKGKAVLNGEAGRVRELCDFGERMLDGSGLRDAVRATGLIGGKAVTDGPVFIRFLGFSRSPAGCSFSLSGMASLTMVSIHDIGSI